METRQHVEAAQFLIVGIGASAGGIEAAKEFFSRVPADSGMAYVFILHLSPEHESHLAQVLQHIAGIPVAQVTRTVKVEPDHVYVIPPSQHLQMVDGLLTVTPNISFEERRAPVDIFFRTLAESHGSGAVAVILSGTGADGSMGIKRIKEKGGVAFVQNPQEAQFDEMPRSSIATSLIDDVLPVADMPAKIIAYKNNLGIIRFSGEPEEHPDEQQRALQEIVQQLRSKTGHDFTNYRLPTLLRRIERRMSVRGFQNLSGYAGFLRGHPNETQALLKDLLISVTNFYRDAKAFESIEKKILPDIFKDKHAGDQVRIWIAGCATGEEAYSLAMLCAELVMDKADMPQVQIFATDIDKDALSTARAGIYTINDAADVSPERLHRFFTKQGGAYRVRNEIREMILFAHHNILKDPPFSRLHLASCRNLLIYLNKQAQQQVMETLHFALHPGGYLLLGNSESVDGATDLYATVSRENRIYQSRQVPVRVPAEQGLPELRSQPATEKNAAQQSGTRQPNPVPFGDLHQQLLAQHAPPSLLVNENYDVLHVSEHAVRYLHLSGGEPTSNVLKLIRPELRLELHPLLYKAVQMQTSSQTAPISVRIHDKEETVRILVHPVFREADTAGSFLLIMFEPVNPADGYGTQHTTTDEPVSRQLEEQLMHTKEQLRSSAEEHELQAEELKAANEELQALNEELRSAAEELETSKEELQSINEELRTVNQELKTKIEEITHNGNDLQNLIISTHIGTLFLDRSFKLALYTPAAVRIFNLLPGDIGRPLTDITNKLVYNGLLTDVETVLDNLQPIEREVATADDRWYTMRLMPYRTAEDRINGVMITFHDITKSKQDEKALRESEENYRKKLEQEVEERTRELNKSHNQYISLAENTPDVITRWNKDLKLIYANRAFRSKTGVPNESLTGKTIREMGQPDEVALSYMNSLHKTFATGETVEHFDFVQTPAGEAQFYSRMVPEKNDSGEVETVFVTERDITAIKKAAWEEVLKLKDERM